MTTALIILRVVIAIYLGLIVVMWLAQERIVFQPPRKPESADTATSTLSYESSDGIPLVAYVVEPAQPGGPIVLAFHGNAMISRWWIPWAREVARHLHATVVLPEYRGYDGLPGKPTYAGAGLDAAAALAATTARFKVAPGEMIYYGHSLGTAVATELASASPPRALVLEAPFTSARDMAGRMPVVGLRWFWRAISRVHWETSDRVAALDVPIFVAHGERDIVIPSRMGRAVYDAARRKGELLIVPGGDHNDVPITGGASYWRWFGEALRGGPH